MAIKSLSAPLEGLFWVLSKRVEDRLPKKVLFFGVRWQHCLLSCKGDFQIIKRFECEDRYEAEKLAGLASVQKNCSTYIAGVAAVIGNEIVIKLKDRSSHAVLMKDEGTAVKLKILLQDVVDGTESIQASDFENNIAIIKLGSNKSK